jgi:hypothetical protein
VLAALATLVPHRCNAAVSGGLSTAALSAALVVDNGCIGGGGKVRAMRDMLSLSLGQRQRVALQVVVSKNMEGFGWTSRLPLKVTGGMAFNFILASLNPEMCTLSFHRPNTKTERKVIDSQLCY